MKILNFGIMKTIYKINKMRKNNKYFRLESSQNQKQTQIKNVYSKLKKNFNEEGTKIKMPHQKPSFDDNLLNSATKTLPKLQIQSKKHTERKKFYSNKLIVNESIYIHQREQLTPQESIYDFKKISIPHPVQVQESSILSERSRRLVSLFKRASMEAMTPRQKITSFKKFKSKEETLENSLLQEKQQAEKHQQARILDMLKVAKERKEKNGLPQVRAKSNMIINSIQFNNVISPIKNEDPGKASKSKDQKKAQKSLSPPKRSVIPSQSSLPYRGIKFVKKIYNWQTAPFSLSKINKTEFISLIQSYLLLGEVKPITSGYYKAYVGPGNNNLLIKKILKERGHWCFVESLDDDPHFVWTQQKMHYFLNKLEPSENRTYKSNSNQLDEQQTQKTKLQIQNFIRVKENEFINACQKLLTAKNFQKLMKQIMKRFMNGKSINWYAKLRNIVINVYNQTKYQITETIESNKIKLHNHIQNSSAIGNKKGLYHYLKVYSQLFNEDINTLIPTTVHVKDQQGITELLTVLPQGPWIVKPGQSTNRGQGITIHVNQQSLQTQLSKKKKHKGGNDYTYIVQSYIDPLLYHGRKFDIRIWVLWNGRQVWWYREGYIRTSSKQYTIKNTNKFIHLTNDAIQSQADDFGKFQPANKISFNQFQKYLDIQFGYKRFHEGILTQMKQLTTKTFKIANMVMDQKNRKYTFQLFGMDFLIDRNFKVWLIQCNTNPSLEVNCSLLARLIPNMVDNMMSLAVDPYFTIPQKKQLKQNNNWNQQSFKFELLYDGNQDIELREKSLLNKDLDVQFEDQQD